MSNADRLARLHEFLKDSVRQEILLKLGEHDKLSFDELMKELKIDDQKELYDELKNLDSLVTKVKDDEYSLPKKGVSEMLGEQYMLTEEGHDALDEMIAYPELESDNYRNGFDNKTNVGHNQQACNSFSCDNNCGNHNSFFARLSFSFDGSSRF